MEKTIYVIYKETSSNYDEYYVDIIEAFTTEKEAEKTVDEYERTREKYTHYWYQECTLNYKKEGK